MLLLWRVRATDKHGAEASGLHQRGRPTYAVTHLVLLTPQTCTECLHLKAAACRALSGTDTPSLAQQTAATGLHLRQTVAIWNSAENLTL